MAAFSNVHCYFPSIVNPSTGNLTSQTVTWFDLRKILAASTIASIGSTAMVEVTLLASGDTMIKPRWPKTEFEAAKALSLAAE